MMRVKPFQEIVHEGIKLTALPALFDPHVHFRTPGHPHKEDWKTASFAAIYGGVTTVCDMPNNTPSCTTIERLRAKKKLIDAELRAVGIPLHYGLYLGADAHHLDEISKAKGEACAIKVFMGGSTGDLLVDSQDTLEEIFKRAADVDMVVAVHAEDETLLNKRKKEFSERSDVAVHSEIRSPEVARVAVERAINLSAKFGTKLYLLHLSCEAELALVRAGKKAGLKIFAETTPHHLFLSTDDYERLGTFVQMNPPLRGKKDQEALWKALVDGTIDTIGTDHAPHTSDEKRLPYGKAPSGIPGIDLLLPLLLNAVHEKKLTLERMVELTRTNAMKLFAFPDHDDLVYVDMTMEKEVGPEDIKTKCGWSPYSGRKLRGWPLYTLIGKQCISHKRVREKPRQEGYRNESKETHFVATPPQSRQNGAVH